MMSKLSVNNAYVRKKFILLHGFFCKTRLVLVYILS